MQDNWVNFFSVVAADTEFNLWYFKVKLFTAFSTALPQNFIFFLDPFHFHPRTEHLYNFFSKCNVFFYFLAKLQLLSLMNVIVIQSSSTNQHSKQAKCLTSGFWLMSKGKSKSIRTFYILALISFFFALSSLLFRWALYVPFSWVRCECDLKRQNSFSSSLPTMCHVFAISWHSSEFRQGDSILWRIAFKIYIKCCAFHFHTQFFPSFIRFLYIFCVFSRSSLYCLRLLAIISFNALVFCYLISCIFILHFFASKRNKLLLRPLYAGRKAFASK